MKYYWPGREEVRDVVVPDDHVFLVSEIPKEERARRVKSFAEQNNIYPVGWSAWAFQNELIDGGDWHNNLQNAIAFSIIHEVIKEEERSKP